ncbi:MAG: hypothetical protein IJ438_02605 [Clostridia bacterium]|nr:hypothetical protein [Clostridia bacterium]
MQQLYLTGIHADDVAARLFTALNVRPAGYRLLPFEVGGETRGEALHLLLPPSAPLYNDVPCRIRTAEGAASVVTKTLEDVAAPSLLAALNVHTPMLLCGMTADMLRCKAFREAVQQCLLSPRPVVVVADKSAQNTLRKLTPAEKQLWIDVDGRQDAALEALLSEAMMRF